MLLQTTYCQLGLYPRADRYLTPFRLLSCVLLYYQTMSDAPATCSGCKACTMKLTHSNGIGAETLNSVGCDMDECIRAYHRRDLWEMCVGGRGPTPGILRGRGRITSGVDVRRGTAVTCVNCMPRGCGNVYTRVHPGQGDQSTVFRFLSYKMGDVVSQSVFCVKRFLG